MRLIKIDNTVLQIQKIKKYTLKENGDVIIVFDRNLAYRLQGKNAEKIRDWLFKNAEEI